MIPADAENPARSRPGIGRHADADSRCPKSAWVGGEKGKKLCGKCVSQRWENISTVVFLYGSWELVEEFWMKKERGEREYDAEKDVVVLEGKTR